MPKFTGFFAVPKFDQTGYRARLEIEVHEAVNKAWRAWLAEFLDIVPVWSGQSVASVKELANLIDADVPITPDSNAPDRRNLGQSQGSASEETGPGKRILTFRTAVPHLLVNEKIDARVFGFRLRNPGPYDFVLKAGMEFQESISGYRLPDPWDYWEYTLEGVG
jgi:hypothetical protein